MTNTGVTALWVQPGMTITDGASVSGTVTASTHEDAGPEFMGVKPQRILITIDGETHALTPGHEFRVIAGRELANEVFRTPLSRADWTPGPA